MYYKGISKQSKKARPERVSAYKVKTQSLKKSNFIWMLTGGTLISAAVAGAFGISAHATSPLLEQSAIKTASDKMEVKLNSRATSPSSAESKAIAKQSKSPTFAAPRGIAEGNKVIAQASVSVGGGTVYDAEKRIVKLVETRAGVVTSTKQFVWAGDQLCEERDASGAVTRRFFDMGEQIAGTNYYYTRDQIVFGKLNVVRVAIENGATHRKVWRPNRTRDGYA